MDGNILTDIGLYHYLGVSTIVFSLGSAVILMRRNIIAILMGVELIMNAAALNFVAFERYVRNDAEGGTTGHIVAIFIIVVAAAEAAVALALALNFFNRFNSIHIDDGSELKE